MRLTKIPGAYGYECSRELMRGKQVDVFLDGEKQKSVLEADEEGRFIIRCVLDAQGLVQVDPNKPDEIWRETVHGVVRIEIKDASFAQ